ncbi:MAG: rod shape-determining protein MreC [Phototrophicales bacterium]|nr:MAG: rod shape-determining protein MreC [Phototrophicales bacterium]
MRRGWRANRVFFFLVCMFICVLLLFGSITGRLNGIENILATPLQFISTFFNRAAQTANDFFSNFSDNQSLRRRNAELEEALARSQAELVELREIASDAVRLAELLDYVSTVQNQETLTAEVIGYDQNNLIRTIIINKGARDGVAVGMPVVTRQGLVGRIIDVTALASRVLLITDPSSNVSARLQISRAQGIVQGRLTGNLRMGLIPLEAKVEVGDVVLTSGLGGNFPPDIVIGQVTSVRQFEFELNQEAEVRSLVNFDTLEFVLVITNFIPIDISVFDQESTTP